VRIMGDEVGISHTSVQRIWKEYGLKPHVVRTFKVSNDPHFTEAHSTVKCNGQIVGVDENLTRGSVAEYLSGA
jgi:hypothetical protein